MMRSDYLNIDNSAPQLPAQSSRQDDQDTPAEILVVSDDEIEEVSEDIFGGFQIVRSEFFSQLREPSISFSQGKIGINTACLKKLPHTDYVQILVNREKKMLAVRPCQETDIFSFLWCTYRSKDHKRQARQVTGKMFFMKICALMGWNIDYRYKILGKLVHAKDEYLFVFNLESAQTFLREPPTGDGKTKLSRQPIYPAEWQNQFGIPFEDHKKALQINMFQGYAVYSIKDEEIERPVQPDTPQPESQPLSPPVFVPRQEVYSHVE